MCLLKNEIDREIGSINKKLHRYKNCNMADIILELVKADVTKPRWEAYIKRASKIKKERENEL